MNPLQNAGREFERELNNGSLNNSDLSWARDLIVRLHQTVNARLGQKEGHIVADENIAKLEADAQQVVADVQQLENESKGNQ
jgi:hypothetical protein